MEEWDAFVRRTRRRFAYRQRYKHGEIAPGDEYYYPPRVNPWPIVAVVVAVVALVAAYVTWTDDGPPPAEPSETTVTIPGSAGLSSRDLAGCLSFHTAINDTRNVLRSSQSPEGKELAQSGAMTADLLNGYHRVAEAVAESFNDDRLTALVVEFAEDLASIRNDAVAQESAGTPVWGEVFPSVVERITTFGEAFDRRCARGGGLDEVAS